MNFLNKQKLPSIEVHTNNMLNWMQERRMLPQEWLKKLEVVDQKFKDLLESFPYDYAEVEIKLIGQQIRDKQKTNTPFMYQDAKQIFDLLIKTKDCGQTSFLGYYKSPLTIEW